MTDVPALVADIGGTHARFALIRPGEPPIEPMVMRCADYAGPAEAAEAYLRTVASERPKRAAFAVASPIVGDTVDMTNSSWHFSISAVRDRMNFESFEVVNDFTAVALSVRHLWGDSLIKLGGGEPMADTPIAVLGPGTGLGVSALVPTPDGKWAALATEGGHATMCAVNDREAAIITYLRKRYEHVSAERLLSGPGLVNLYEAVASVSNRAPAYTSPDAITQRGLDGSCSVCKETVDTFFAMLGTFAGNLALTLGARGGVFFAGGILPRMADAFAQSSFRQRFEAKGRFESYLSPIPAWLVVHPHPAFVGLAALVS